MDYPLPFDQVPPQPFKKFDRVNPSLVDQLHQLSAARCAASKDFQKVERNIVHYQEQIAKKAVTLDRSSSSRSGPS